MSLSPAKIKAAYLDACRAELRSLKPGNVHRFASGHGMTAEIFETSAALSAVFLAAPGATVGDRVLGATKASLDAVGLNTNLGIVLLCAPLALAAERRRDGQGLRQSVVEVLAGLDDDDAQKCFAAIALASPGGLGKAGEADVRKAPKIGLVDAMRLAAPRDLIARQYVDGFAEIFDVGVPGLCEPSIVRDDRFGLDAALSCFLAFATRFPDSHVARKFGAGPAEEVRQQMVELERSLRVDRDAASGAARATALDTKLKLDGINPGTSADLTVASLFARNLAEAAGG